jgi:hypothetical protein
LVDFGLLLLWLARAPENAVKALWLLGFVGLLISRMESLPCERRSLDDEQRSLVSHCFIGSAHIAHFAHLKTGGGYPYPAPEGVESGYSALPKDASDYPLLPNDKAGIDRFFVAVNNLANRISDAYGCDQCPGNERAELHQQAAESIEAIKCFVMLARQAGLAIGAHPCWVRWGIVAGPS